MNIENLLQNMYCRWRWRLKISVAVTCLYSSQFLSGQSQTHVSMEEYSSAKRIVE